MPVSMTSTAFVPTTMPTLGTSEAEPSGMAQTWSVSFSVTPSRTSDAGGVGCWARAGAATSADNNNATLRMHSLLYGCDELVGGQCIGNEAELPHHAQVVARCLMPGD